MGSQFQFIITFAVGFVAQPTGMGRGLEIGVGFFSGPKQTETTNFTNIYEFFGFLVGVGFFALPTGQGREFSLAVGFGLDSEE